VGTIPVTRLKTKSPQCLNVVSQLYGHGLTIGWGMASDRIANGWGDATGPKLYLYNPQPQGVYKEKEQHQFNPVTNLIAIAISTGSHTNKDLSNIII